MPEFIGSPAGGVATADAYSNALTLGPALDVAVVNFSNIGANAAAYQFFKPDPANPRKAVLELTERIIIGTTFGAFATGVAGVRFRSAVKGKPASIVASMSFKFDPLVGDGTIAPAPLSVTGTSGPTTLSSLKVTGTAGSHNPIVGASYPCIAVALKALATNTGLVYIGGSGVLAANGYQLAAGEAVALDIADLLAVFFDVDVTGEGLTFLVSS